MDNDAMSSLRQFILNLEAHMRVLDRHVLDSRLPPTGEFFNKLVDHMSKCQSNNVRFNIVKYSTPMGDSDRLGRKGNATMEKFLTSDQAVSILFNQVELFNWEIENILYYDGMIDLVYIWIAPRRKNT